MSDLQFIISDKVPKPMQSNGKYVYSHAVRVGNTLYLSGQVGKGVDQTLPAGVIAQTENALKNVADVLKATGSSLDKVVKCTVLLADMKDFASVNEVYLKYFTKHAPARTCYQAAGLPLGAKVEIECIAIVD